MSAMQPGDRAVRLAVVFSQHGQERGKDYSEGTINETSTTVYILSNEFFCFIKYCNTYFNSYKRKSLVLK